jgi:hypothetical protein
MLRRRYGRRARGLPAIARENPLRLAKLYLNKLKLAERVGFGLDMTQWNL